MSRKKKETIEFRFYEIPQKESALALLGDKWIRKYGDGIKNQHFHNLYEIGLCREGKGILMLDGKTREYKSGDMTFIPANFPHTTYSEKVCFWEYLYIDAQALLQAMYPDNQPLAREMTLEVKRQAIFLPAGVMPGLVEVANRIMEEYRNKKPYYREITRNLLKAFLMGILRHLRDQDAEQEERSDSFMTQIKPALEFAEANYQDAVKVADMAAVCSLSETHFRRLFEDCINMHPMDYLNMVRIQKACEIMRRTDHSMDQVAAECGFLTTSTFNRNFKKFLNSSPYQWKKSKDNFEAKIFDSRVMPLPGW